MQQADHTDAHQLDRCGSCGQPLGYWATDRLTGLSDRWGWDIRAPQLHYEARGHGRSVALLAVDLDHFKQINDEYGHPAGDAVLSAVGQVLRRETRITDLASRYGGDEFLVLAPDRGAEQALALAVRLREGIRAMVTTTQATPDWTVTVRHVTASIGVAVHDPEHELSVLDLRLCADTALRQAKRRGRDRVDLVRPSAVARSFVH